MLQYIYVGYFRDIESIDLYVYKDAEKAEQMGNVEKILKIILLIVL